MKTVFRKSFAVLLSSALGVSLVFTGAVLVFMDSLYYETNTRSLMDAAKTLKSLLPEDAQEWILRQGEDSPFRFTLIQKDGRVLADSHMDAASSENHRGRPEVEAALAGEEGIHRRSSASLGLSFIYAALPVYEDGEITGVFRLSRLVPGFFLRLRNAASSFLLLAGVLFLAAAWGTYVFSRSLSRALGSLVSTARAAAEREESPLSRRPAEPVPAIKEFKVLEEALRSMAAELSRRIETARAESRRLEAILNAMPEAVLVVDSSLFLRRANPRAREIFSLEEGREEAFISLLEATHSPELEEAARGAMDSGSPREIQLTLHGRTAGGRFQVCASPLTPGREDIKGGAVVVMNDITRLVKLEQVRKDFAANVSHELRTPIQLVKGFSENLLDPSLEDMAKARHFAQVIQKNAVSMENLVGDLLFLVRLEDDCQPRPPREEAELAPLFEEALFAVKFQAEKKNIRIETSCPPELKARIYPSLLAQAVINLLDNAVKYSQDSSRVQLAAFTENENLIIEVRDRGMGIPPQHLDRIFERFYRVDKARSREAGGTGLGLAIVRHIALLHGGKVEAQSHAGEGSVFRLTLAAEDLRLP
ncbi:MAG: PAS domain-containing protein [Spirochaetales bacterium]|jgi:two-component system phosphate regulon sensor histidine kinase PhoR|nr:PAS domain-containing protein [Spirochaetales bacterium]